MGRTLNIDQPHLKETRAGSSPITRKDQHADDNRRHYFQNSRNITEYYSHTLAHGFTAGSSSTANRPLCRSAGAATAGNSRSITNFLSGHLLSHECGSFWPESSAELGRGSDSGSFDSLAHSSTSYSSSIT